MITSDAPTPFNPNNPGIANGNYFALPVTANEADIILVSVPWDATTSYRAGTASGPAAIIAASEQVDLFDPHVRHAADTAIYGVPAKAQGAEDLAALNAETRVAAEAVIDTWGTGGDPNSVSARTQQVNTSCEAMNRAVEETCRYWQERGKLVGVVGGEHSVPLGLMRAHARRHEDFGILHIDAHADLRQAYEGFTYSHASIMYNALSLPQVNRLVQVGIRDWCEDEQALQNSDPRIVLFADHALREAQFKGTTWDKQCRDIVDALPDKVHISFDIDGLDPSLCPHTGTPVPGGLHFREADYLLWLLSQSGKRIIGFDLCEVAPSPEDGTDEWDANVGARLLYKLCCYFRPKG